MPVPKEYTGVDYRQVAMTLKIYTDDKPSERRVSQRPRVHMDSAPGPGNPYTDSDEAPTLIRFKATDQVDVPGLLATGAIVEYKAPAKAEPPKAEKGGDPSGENKP